MQKTTGLRSKQFIAGFGRVRLTRRIIRQKSAWLKDFSSMKKLKSKSKRKKFSIKIRKAKRSTLVSRLDAVFSLFIRQKYAKNGLVACYTCPKILPIKRIQN